MLIAHGYATFPSCKTPYWSRRNTDFGFGPSRNALKPAMFVVRRVWSSKTRFNATMPSAIAGSAIWTTGLAAMGGFGTGGGRAAASGPCAGGEFGRGRGDVAGALRMSEQVKEYTFLVKDDRAKEGRRVIRNTWPSPIKSTG